MRLAWAFICRDAAIALSYRVAFVVQLLGNFLLVGILYYLSKTVGLEKVPSLERYGGNLMAFLLIGIALTDCVLVSLVGFAQQVRESQTTGTLEATLMSPVRLTVILIYSSFWNYFLSAVRFLMYLAAGLVIGGLRIDTINPVSAITIFILTVASFMGIGILWAGVVLLVKRGEALMSMMSVLVLLVSGVLFPVTLLPNWLQWFASAIPLTAALEGMRLSIMRNASLIELSSITLQMTGFAVFLLLLGISGFNYAVKIGRRQGSLTQY
jgi:ABC-2 type transport system permease protein